MFVPVAAGSYVSNNEFGLNGLLDTGSPPPAGRRLASVQKSRISNLSPGCTPAATRSPSLIESDDELAAVT